MELCIARAFSNLPHHTTNFISPNRNCSHLPWKSALPFNRTLIHHYNTGYLYDTNSSLRSTTSEETSTAVSQYVKDEPDSVVSVEDNQSEKNELAETGENESPKADSSLDNQFQLSELLQKFNIKLDSEYSYSIILFGGVGLVGLWLATAIVGAIDSIPLFPKLLEIIGLGYTFWFTTRYLLFKKSRDELATKIEEIKQQVIGSLDD